MIVPTVDAQEHAAREQAMRRLFDIMCAAAGLLILAPVFAIVALFIVLRDGRPVLFSQMRIGLNGRPFRIWKFRTMRQGSRGSAITAARDCRITRAGALLRKHKLDELPQLLNVLKGDMSLVGPRPEVPEYVQPGAPLWQAVLQVRPGITDLASLWYREEEKMLQASSDASRDAESFYREHVLTAKLLLNVSYLRTRSFRQDLRLIWLTIRYSLCPERFQADLIHRSFGAGA